MKLLLFGELGPGALARSFEPGLATESAVLASDPYCSQSGSSAPPWMATARLGRRFNYRARVAQAGPALVETVDQLRPDAVLLVKGRGIDAGSITRVRGFGVPVALYYPDNPAWAFSDTRGVRERLLASTLAVVWSERLAAQLAGGGARTRVLPFGYDPRWWGPTPPGGNRHGIAFLGQWSPRRERYLAALAGLPLVVRGTGWDRTRVPAGLPAFGPRGGALLSGAVIGVNVLHPQCAGAHNMRTREITATGALQLTNPGTDGTPLRDRESCAWFESPDELRALAEHYLSHPDEAAVIAGKGQELTRNDTCVERGRTLARWLAELV
jgi:hypothetical protein